MHVHVCSGVQRPEDEAGYPEAGVTGSSEHPGNVSAGSHTRVSFKAEPLSRTEWSPLSVSRKTQGERGLTRKER